MYHEYRCFAYGFQYANWRNVIMMCESMYIWDQILLLTLVSETKLIQVKNHQFQLKLFTI